MIGFPLLLIPLAIYNIIAFLMPGVSLTDPLVKLTLMSGTEWPVTLSDVLLALGVFLLLLEIIKGARPGAKYLTDHLLSLIVFGAAAAEFVLWPKFGSSTYFLLALLSLVDFLSGIALRARRGAAVAPATGVPRKGKKAEPQAAEPQFEPVLAPAPSVPAAASVAESVLLDRPEPSLQQPSLQQPSLAQPSLVQPGLAQPGLAPRGVASHAPSPEVSSPGL